MYKTIFLKENEKDIFQALKKQGIKTKVFEHRLADLFNRVYNNYVGYYVFKQDDVVYKMIVLPKTIEPSDSAEKEFVNYLLHYYRINNIYKLDREKKIPNSLLHLVFESNNSKHGSHNLLDEFQSHRYRAILQAIEDFFKRHKNSKRIKVDYVSQSIKYKLNLKRNIKELDKTKIHQIQSKDVVFSMLATVTYNALKLFVTQKYSGLEEKYKDELFKEVKRLQATLLKKYKIEKGYKFSIATLQGIKLTKLFGKTGENRQLLVDIKSLFGFEQMYKDNAVSVEYKQDLTTTSLFVNPSNFYEWYVYDILNEYANNNLQLKFVGNANTTTKYNINKNIIDSKPDFILTDEIQKVNIVLDAKWKNINNFSDIQSSDYLKLQFDAALLAGDGFGTVSYLIYPKMNIADRVFEIKFEDKEIYHFNAFEIDMNFADMRKNSLSFKYDFKQKAKKIKEEQKKESSKQSAVRSSQNIQPKRDSVIQKLINAETTEEKEALGGLFDETLWQQNEQLTKVLNVDIILPEVQGILDKFKDIMEEESIIFIKSTSTIYAHYRDEENIVFDYSMPGSGLWKLIEVELNTSFVRYIRYKEGVISKDSCWESILHIDQNRKIDWVKLNERDKDNKLKGLMFGQLKFLSKNHYVISMFDSIVEYDFDEQWNILDKVVKYRNEHAHIKAMSKEIFTELWNLLFEKDAENKSQLQKLLGFKRNMKVLIDE